MQVIINKFPEQLVDEWCEVFFLPLAQRLSGDPSSKCRESVGACLRALMQRVSSGPLDKLVQYCVIWLGGNQPKLTRTAAQVPYCISSVSEAVVSKLQFLHII